MTYQKANEIVKKFVNEDKNLINYLKLKIEEKFKLIHYIYSLLFSKIYNRTNHFGIQNKGNFDFYFQTWKSRKQNGAVGTKILNHLAPDENEQHPIDFKIPDETFQPTMVEIKTNNDLSKKRAEKRKQLERQLSEKIKLRIKLVNKIKAK